MTPESRHTDQAGSFDASVSRFKRILDQSGLAQTLPEGCSVHHTAPSCHRCGLTIDVKHLSFDRRGLCSLCRRYALQQERISHYFSLPGDLDTSLRDVGRRESRHDCVQLVTGGCHGTYALARLASVGVRVLAVTLDSDFLGGTRLNFIQRVAHRLNIELLRLRPATNRTFDEFIAMACDIARDRNIPYIVTGRSRGRIIADSLQWYFDRNIFEPAEIDLARRSERWTCGSAASPRDLADGNESGAAPRIEILDYYRHDDISFAGITSSLRSRDCLPPLNTRVRLPAANHASSHLVRAWNIRIGHVDMRDHGSGSAHHHLSEQHHAADENGAVLIGCQIREHVSDAQVCSYLDREAPQWQEHFRLAYASEILPAADNVVAKPWCSQSATTCTQPSVMTAEDQDRSGLCESVVLEAKGVALSHLRCALRTVLFDHRWMRTSEHADAIQRPALQEVHIGQVCDAALDLLLSRIHARNQMSRERGLSAHICHRGDLQDPWIVLTGEPELISWAEWFALVHDLGSALLSHAVDSDSNSQWPRRAANLLSSPARNDVDPEVPTLPEMTWVVSDLHTLRQPVEWDAQKLLAALTIPDPATYSPTARLEVLNDRDRRHTPTEFVRSQVCRVLSDSSISIGIRVVDRDESQLPSPRHLLPLVDPKGRWIAKSSTIQMVLEACAAPTAVVHASRMEPERADDIARKVLRTIFEGARAG